jgi:hypothetical protein
MKKITFFLVAAVTIISIATVQSCKSSGKTSAAKLLKFNLEKGKGYDYEMVWDINTKVMGQETGISIGGLYSMNITDDDGKVKSVATSYKSLNMNMKVGGVEINIDSDKAPKDNGEAEEKNPMAIMRKVISGIIGKTFVIKVDEEGKVLEVTGFDKIMNDIIDSMDIDEDIKTQTKTSMKGQFSEQSMKDQFAQVFTIFPNKEIRVGDSWEKTYSTGGKMPAKYSTTYTVTDIEGDHVNMTSKTKIESNTGEMEMDGKQNGNIIVDSKTGLMVNAEYTQDMEVRANGMKIAITGKGKIKGKAN